MGSSAASSAVIIRFSKRTRRRQPTTRPCGNIERSAAAPWAARARGIMPSNAMGLSNPANTTICAPVVQVIERVLFAKLAHHYAGLQISAEGYKTLKVRRQIRCDAAVRPFGWGPRVWSQAGLVRRFRLALLFFLSPAHWEHLADRRRRQSSSADQPALLSSLNGSGAINARL
jgi:hypothetical protein